MNIGIGIDALRLGGAGMGGGAWTPKRIPDVLSWVSADGLNYTDLAKTTLAGDTDLVAVMDSRGTGDYEQSVSTARPTLEGNKYRGLSALNFGVDDVVTRSCTVLNNTSGATFVFSVTKTGLGANHALYGEGQADSGSYFIIRSNATGILEVVCRSAFGATDILQFGAALFPKSTPTSIHVTVAPNRVVTCYVDGVIYGTPQSVTAIPTTLTTAALCSSYVAAFSQYFNGTLLESYVVPRVLSQSELTTSVKYLRRWV